MERIRRIAATVGRGKGGMVGYSACFDPKKSADVRFGHALPHWQQNACLIFLTFRLADALPKNVIDLLADEYIYNQHPTSDELDKYIQARYRDKIEAFVDNGYGECLLSDDRARDALERVLLEHDTNEYDLYDYVIMPNHVHLILRPYDELANILRIIKGASAFSVNKALNRKGKVWQKEYFDHLVRTIEDCSRLVEYIKNNPSSLPKNAIITRRY